MHPRSHNEPSPNRRWVDTLIKVNPLMQDVASIACLVFFMLNFVVMCLDKGQYYTIPVYASVLSAFVYMTFSARPSPSRYQTETGGIKVLLFIFIMGAITFLTLTYIAQLLDMGIAGPLAATTLAWFVLGIIVCALTYPELAAQCEHVDGDTPSRDPYHDLMGPRYNRYHDRR